MFWSCRVLLHIVLPLENQPNEKDKRWIMIHIYYHLQQWHVFFSVSVWVMCWPSSNLLTRRNPGCWSKQHQQVLPAVLLWWVAVCSGDCFSLPSLYRVISLLFLCVTVCDVNQCPESFVSCAHGLSLVQTTLPGQCCPQHHCGIPFKNAHMLMHYSWLVSSRLLVDDCNYLYPLLCLSRLCINFTLPLCLTSFFFSECQCEDTPSPICSVVSQRESSINV